MNPKNKSTVVVEYYSDPTKMIDDHNSEPVYLTEINERIFTDVFEAIRFMTECTSVITHIEDIVPLSKRPKGFKFILPENNIKIKHQANNSIDSIFEQ